MLFRVKISSKIGISGGTTGGLTTQCRLSKQQQQHLKFLRPLIYNSFLKFEEKCQGRSDILAEYFWYFFSSFLQASHPFLGSVSNDFSDWSTNFLLQSIDEHNLIWLPILWDVSCVIILVGYFFAFADICSLTILTWIKLTQKRKIIIIVFDFSP